MTVKVLQSKDITLASMCNSLGFLVAFKVKFSHSARLDNFTIKLIYAKQIGRLSKAYID